MVNHVRRCTGLVGALSVVALLVMSSNGATAADFGGDCCADLEERIAELEATTARKGNRKVSLTVAGYVAHEITWWDDGGESNTYIHGLGPTQASHLKLLGQAQIAPGWTAGYFMRIQSLHDNPFGRDAATGEAMNQVNSTFNQGLNTQMSYWFVESKTLGKISVGRQAHAAKSAGMFTDLSGTQVFDNETFLSGFPQFNLRSKTTGALLPATWGNLAFCHAQAVPLGGDCNGIVMNGVRYDTPVLGGFSASVSWGADDVFEAAARFKTDVAGLKLALGVGYSKHTDESITGPAVTLDKDSENIQAGAYIQHVASGLFLNGTYGHENNNDTVLLNGTTALDGEHWSLKGGVRQSWTKLGATIIYADYAEYLDQLGPAALKAGATSSELQRFGGGIAQEIDAAATTLYMKYEVLKADVEGAPALADLEDAHFFSLGGIVNF